MPIIKIGAGQSTIINLCGAGITVYHEIVQGRPVHRVFKYCKEYIFIHFDCDLNI